MTLVGLVHSLELIDFHVERLLVLADVPHLAQKLRADFFVLLYLLEHHFGALILIHVLMQPDFLEELVGGLQQFRDLLRDLALDFDLPFICLLASLAELVRKLGLQLVGCSNLPLTALLLLADDLGIYAELKNAAVQLDRVLHALEVLVDALHALNLAHVGSYTLRIFANCIDLLLEPVLLLLDTMFHN